MRLKKLALFPKFQVLKITKAVLRVYYHSLLAGVLVESPFISGLSIRTQTRGQTGASQACKQALSGALGAGELKLSAPPPAHSRPPESLLRASATHLLLLFVAVTTRLRRKIASFHFFMENVNTKRRFCFPFSALGYGC